MRKQLIAIILIIVSMVSCDAAKQQLSGMYNLVNCKYTYASISGMSISGMNLSNGLSLTSIPKITSILSGSATSIPLDFTLNLNVNNPNQTAAMMNGMQYVISIDDIQFTTGNVKQTLNIGAGQTQSLPLTIGVDLASLMKSNSKSAITEIAKNFIGIGSKQSHVSVQLKPTFMVGNTPVTSPMYIPLSFSFGGSK